MYADLALSQKLERTEARANADFVETRARLQPESGATWIEVAGAYAMFDGVGSPLTQTFGLGIFEEPTDEHLDQLETFFRDRGSDIFHEVSPLVDVSLLGRLTDRGYRPIELTSVMYLELNAAPERGHPCPPESQSAITCRRITDDEAAIWTETAAQGWATEHESLADFIRGFGSIATRTAGAHPFVAELEGRPIATGGLQIYDEVCILAGASTTPAARRRGAQNALLAARLAYARTQGCTLALMCAAPGSQSQKNAQKNGFNIAYTRTKWHLAA